MEKITLEGKTYYQQGRRCGRAGCALWLAGALFMLFFLAQYTPFAILWRGKYGLISILAQVKNTWRKAAQVGNFDLRLQSVDSILVYADNFLLSAYNFLLSVDSCR